MRKKYKALICDVDGTLISLGTTKAPFRLPTDAVCKALTKAKEKIHIGIATSRPLSYTEHLLDHLSLSGPSIVQSGSLVVDSVTKKILWDKQLEKKDFDAIMPVLTDLFDQEILIDQPDKTNIPYTSSYIFNRVINIFIDNVRKEQIDKVKNIIKDVSTLTLHQVPAWNRKKDNWAFALTHAAATKQHAIFEVAKLLGIETHEIIGIGDGHNDFPLLMACGLKVAMGNAVPELKAIADYIAPSVEDNGVVDVIEKFVLS